MSSNASGKLNAITCCLLCESRPPERPGAPAPQKRPAAVSFTPILLCRRVGNPLACRHHPHFGRNVQAPPYCERRTGTLVPCSVKIVPSCQRYWSRTSLLFFFTCFARNKLQTKGFLLRTWMNYWSNFEAESLSSARRILLLRPGGSLFSCKSHGRMKRV